MLRISFYRIVGLQHGTNGIRIFQVCQAVFESFDEVSHRLGLFRPPLVTEES